VGVFVFVCLRREESMWNHFSARKCVREGRTEG